MNNETLSQFDRRRRFSSTMPPVASQGERVSDKLGAAVGVALIGCGLVFNEWVIARIASSDGQIEATSIRTLILTLDGLLVLTGAFIFKYPHFARVALPCIISFLSVGVLSFVLFTVLELFSALIKYMPFGHAHYYTIRNQQIAAKNNTESALGVLCRELGLELVSLSLAFERVASPGQFLYYPFDTHWNSEARQIAASILAERLSSIKTTN